MTERKINKRRLTVIFLCVCTLGLFGGAFYAYRLHHISAGFMAMRTEGLKDAAAGRSTPAVLLLGQYLGRYPNDIEVLSVYARNCPLAQLPENDNVSRAIWALRHMLRLDPSRLEARRQLMGLYLESGYSTEALDEADAILTARLGAVPGPNSHLEQTGSAVASDATPDPSISSVVSKLQKYPDALEAIGAETKSLQRLHNRNRDALVACEWWIAADPSNVDAALAQVDLEYQNHRPAGQAIGLALKWTANHANLADNNLVMGHVNLVYLDFNQAHDKLKNAGSGDPSTDLAIRVLIADLDAVQEPDLARTLLGRALAKDPKNNAIRFALVCRHWDLAHWSEVVDLTSNVQGTTPLPVYIIGLRATALMNLGMAAETTQALSELADRKNDREAAAWVVLLQQSMERHPDSMLILKACQAGLDQTPRDYYLRYFMASTFAQQGDRDAAIREWQRVSDEDRSWAMPPMRLANSLLEAGHTEQALEAAKVASGRSRGEITTVLLESWVANVEAGHKEDAADLLKSLSALYRDNPHNGNVIVLYSSLLASLGQTEQATGIINTALNAPDVLPEQSWVRLASVCESQHLNDKAHPHLLERSALARSQKEHGITPGLAYAKAVAANDFQSGIASFDADEAAAPQQSSTTQPATSPDAQPVNLVMGWDLYRAYYLELNHDPAAAAAWVTLADRNPSQPRVQRLVLSADSVKADKDLSARCIDRIGQLGGHDSPDWRLARARWLVRFAPFLDSSKQPTPQATEARTLLDSLISETPGGLEIRLISAQAFELAKDIPAAIGELRFASSLNPQAVSIRLTLARMLEQEGDFEAVQEQLDHLTDADLQMTDQRRQAAAMFAQQGQVEHAIKLLVEDSAANKESGTASLLLGQLYLRRGDLNNAEACFNKLLAGQVDAPAVRFGAELYLAQGRAEKAAALLNRLGKDITCEPGVAELIRADFAFKDPSPGAKEQAIALLQAATRAAPANPLTWRALAAANLYTARPEKALDAANAGLRVIPDDKTLLAIGHHPAMLSYASGKVELLPMLQYFVNDPSTGSAATSALEDIYNDSLTPKPKPDAKTKPRDVLSEQLQQLADKFPRFEPLQLYLIARYTRQTPPRYDDAIAVAQAAGRVDPDSAQLARMTTECMLAANRYAEALAAADRWHDIPHLPHVQQIQAILAKADALKHLQQPKEELDLLQPLFEAYVRAGSPASDDEIAMRYRDALSADGTKPDLASLMKSLLSRPGKDGPSGRFQWMRFAVNNLSSDEAEGWLETAKQSIPDKTTPDGQVEMVHIANMYRLLGARSSNPRYNDIAKTMLLSLAATDHPQAKILVALGELFDAGDHRVEAANDYRQAIEAPLCEKEDLLVAQNNLAMDLARTGHAADGLPFIDAALKSLPRNAELLDSRAFVRLTAGDSGGALDDMREATQLSSEPRFHLELVQMLIDTNHRKDAEGELKVLDSMSDLLSPEQSRQLKELHAKASVASAL